MSETNTPDFNVVRDEEAAPSLSTVWLVHEHFDYNSDSLVPLGICGTHEAALQFREDIGKPRAELSQFRVQ